MSAPFFFLLLLLLLCSAATAIAKSLVTKLPGLDEPLPLEFETGYVNIDETKGIELFYYFFKSENKPADDPLLIWFSGGPGCSGLNAIFFGNGPFTVKIEEYNGNVPPIELNPYAWTKVSNVLYVDAPVGTGFSYSETEEGWYSNDTLSAKQSYTFIRKWLMAHREFLSHSVLIGGDSYSGMVVPIIVQNIAEGIEAGDRPHINLKGYLLGNPMTYDNSERNFRVPFAHGMGLISHQLYKSLHKHCNGDYINEFPTTVQCNKNLDAVEECLSGLWLYNTLLPKCDDIVPEPIQMVTDKISRAPKLSTPPDPYWPCEVEELTSGRRLRKNSRNPVSSSPSQLPSLECSSTYGFLLSYYWANDERVQNALNIRKGKVQTWIRCNKCGIKYKILMDNHVPYHVNLSKRGIRSLIYSGDHDLVVPFISTDEWITSLNYPVTDEWRPWLVDGQVTGYTRSYANNMTFATVKGAGHVAMETHPKECLDMYKRWMSHKPL